METISIIFLTSFALFIIYCIFNGIKSMFTKLAKQEKITQEQKRLKLSKIIYFVCSSPFLFLIINSIYGLIRTFGQPMSRFMSGHAEGEIFAAILILLLSYGYLMLNYHFIKVALKRKIEGWKSILLLSCLPGLSYPLTFISAEAAIFGIVVLIIAPVMNAYIVSESKKEKTSGKSPKHDIDDDLFD